jgi:hypothetical protein
MSRPTQRALGILLAAFVAALALRAVTLFVPDRLAQAVALGVLGAATAALAALGIVRLPPRAEWHHGLLALLAVSLVWRDSEALFALNLLAVLAGLALAAPRARRPSLARAGVTDYLAAGVTTAVGTLVGMVPLLGAVEWRGLPAGRRLHAVRGIAVGAVVASPVLAVFTGLFRSADPAFDHLAGRVLDVDLGEGARHALFVAGWTWLVAGFLRTTFAAPAQATTPWRWTPRRGFVEVGTALGLVAALFLAFVLVQFHWLFGGAEAVRSTASLTYAEYARRGFFELVCVAALSLPLLLVAEWAVDKEDVAGTRHMRRLAGLVVVLLFVILASALERMRLYTVAYGLTEQRLYATAFMAWVAVVLGWLVATVLRGRRRRFAAGTVVAAVGTLMMLGFANPDALIVRVNAARIAGGGAFDAGYVAELSLDAVPALLAALPALPEQERCALAPTLARWRSAAERGARWNLAVAAARPRLRELAAAVDAAGCPAASAAATR